MSIRNPSITYLIASTGRDTLKDTLRSLHGQFAFGLDKIRLYFDGGFEFSLNTFTEEFGMFGEDIMVAPLGENLGFWGHGIRNKYQDSCSTDYIHHMDDDDGFCPNVFHLVRQDLKDNYGKILIYKFKTIGKDIIWKDKAIRFGNVGTPSGLIFNRPEIFGTWGYEYGGDFQFYNDVENNIGKENVVFKDRTIVAVRPHIYGY